MKPIIHSDDMETMRQLYGGPSKIAIMLKEYHANQRRHPMQKLIAEYQQRIDDYDKQIKANRRRITLTARHQSEKRLASLDNKRLNDLRQQCVQFIKDLEDIS